MKYFSMFTGIGGFEYGIQQAIPNAECVGYSEIDKNAIQTYEKHFKHKNYGDATKIVPTELPDFDMLCGGFPCQTFSVAGKRRGFEDTRGTLFFDIARILEVKRPKLVLLENVKGLLNHNKGQTFSTIIQTLEKLGYRTQWMVLNSKFFGVPQNRERVFIIGNLRGEPRTEILPFKQSETMDGKMEEQAEIIKIENSGREMARAYSPEGVRPTLRVPSGGWHSPNIKVFRGRPRYKNGQREIKLYEYDEMPTLSQNSAMGDQKNILMTTITQAFGRIGHSRKEMRMAEIVESNTTQLRRLTPKECERLQGFPDDWTKGVSDTQRYKQSGNAVTTKVIKAIMENLK